MTETRGMEDIRRSGLGHGQTPALPQQAEHSPIQSTGGCFPGRNPVYLEEKEGAWKPGW